MLIDGLIAMLTTASGPGAGVQALIGSKVYENVLPRGYNLPAVAIHQYNATQEYQYSGPASVGVTFIQFDCYGDSATSARAVAAAIRAALVSFTGTLPDGTVIQLCKLDRSMAMPFLPHADAKGLADRWLMGFEIASLTPQV